MRCRRNRRSGQFRHQRLRNAARPVRTGPQQADRIGTLICGTRRQDRTAAVQPLLPLPRHRALCLRRPRARDFCGARPAAGTIRAAKAQEDEIIARVKSPIPAPAISSWSPTRKSSWRLTGVSAHEGEAVIVKAEGDKLRVLGKITLQLNRAMLRRQATPAVAEMPPPEEAMISPPQCRLRQSAAGCISAHPVTKTGASTTAGAFVSARAGGIAGPVYGAASGRSVADLAQW